MGSHPVAVVLYTFTHKQYTERLETNNSFGTMRAVPRLCELYPGICPTTEEKAGKTLRQGRSRVPAGTFATASFRNLLVPKGII